MSQVKDIEIYDPQIKEMPSEVEIRQPLGLSAQWLTPGLYMAQRISENSFVRFVGEKYESDYLQTIIVVDNDPEDLVDKIFEIEQKMFKRFGSLRFDVRVRVIPPAEKIGLIRDSSVTHFERNKA